VKEKQKYFLTLLQNNTDWLVISLLSKRHYFDDIQKHSLLAKINIKSTHIFYYANHTQQKLVS